MTKTRELFSFLPLIISSATIVWCFFVAKHISNHIIKYYQYFAFFISIVFINIFINIIHIIGRGILRTELSRFGIIVSVISDFSNVFFAFPFPLFFRCSRFVVFVRADSLLHKVKLLEMPSLSLDNSVSK